MTAVSASALYHPSRACSFTRPTLDSRFMGCSIGNCQNAWRLPTPPAPAQGHSATSKAAAASVSRLGARERVLAAVRKAGKPYLNPEPFGCVFGATDEEIAEATGMNPSSARPRRVELQRDGLIMDSGYTRKTKSNRAAVVWMVAVGS